VSLLFDRCENVGSVVVAVDAVLAVLALRPGTPNPSGLAVMCTESYTYAAPVVEGVYVHSAVVRTHLGLNTLARYFTELARAQVQETDPEAYKVFWENVDLSRSLDMLKSACFVALDYEKDYATYDDEGPCGLPQYFGEDGRLASLFFLRLTSARTQRNPHGVVLLDQAHFQACEALFQPDLLTSGEAGAAAAAAAVAGAAASGDPDHHLPPTGIVTVVMKAIKKLPDDQQHLMFLNICLLGKGTMLQNLNERLRRDVARVVPDHKVVVRDLLNSARHLPYIGACVLQLHHPEAVRLPAITREAYEKAPLCENAAFRELQCTVFGRRSEHMTEIPPGAAAEDSPEGMSNTLKTEN
jgi:actin-related protein